MAARPRIFAAHRLPAAVEVRLNQAFDVEWNLGDADLPPEELIARTRSADGLISTVTDPLPAAVFEAGGPLKIVANFGVGVDRIDLAAAKVAGVAVTNTPGVLTECTADLTIGLILMTMRRLGEGERLVRAGAWTGWRPTHLLGRRTSGATLGIIGFGRIGVAVARRARHGFGMRILYAGRREADAAVAAELGARRCPLEELLAASDVVSLHVPASPDTEGLLDRRRLGLLRPSATLVNTARGALVDEEALADLLESGRLAGAGLDVFRGEPRISPRLLAAPNLVLLPHLGSATVETRTAMGDLVADNLEAFFAGREPPNRVA